MRVLRWDGGATARAADSLTEQSAHLSRAAAQIAEVGHGGTGVAGHRDVATGLGEFGAYWSAWLDRTEAVVADLGRRIAIAGRAYGATESGAVRSFDGGAPGGGAGADAADVATGGAS